MVWRAVAAYNVEGYCCTSPNVIKDLTTAYHAIPKLMITSSLHIGCKEWVEFDT